MTEQEYSLYKNINFYNRYNSFREKYVDVEPTLEKYEIIKVLEIFKELGYEKVKFMKSGRFFKVRNKEKPFDFYFHASLKYGICELILGGENTEKDIFIGGVYGNIMDDILFYKDNLEERFPLCKLPLFRTAYISKISTKLLFLNLLGLTPKEDSFKIYNKICNILSKFATHV